MQHCLRPRPSQKTPKQRAVPTVQQNHKIGWAQGIGSAWMHCGSERGGENTEDKTVGKDSAERKKRGLRQYEKILGFWCCGCAHGSVRDWVACQSQANDRMMRNTIDSDREVTRFAVFSTENTPSGLQKQ